MKTLNINHLRVGSVVVIRQCNIFSYWWRKLFKKEIPVKHMILIFGNNDFLYGELPTFRFTETTVYSFKKPLSKSETNTFIKVLCNSGCDAKCIEPKDVKAILNTVRPGCCNDDYKNIDEMFNSKIFAKKCYL